MFSCKPVLKLVSFSFRLFLQLLEFCDRGSLSEAIDKGKLRVAPYPGAPINIRAVVATAQDIAKGLVYLHR